MKAGTKCSVCEALITMPETINAKGHTEVVVPGEEATCGKEGKTEGKVCSVCNAVIVAQTTIPMTTEHNYVETVVKAATCEVAGEKTSKCSICGDEKAAEVIPALGHVWSEEQGYVKQAATCVAKGLWEVPCVRTFEDGAGCKEEGRKVTDIEINPENHANLVVLPAVAANCENTGLTEGEKCEACNVVTVEQIVTEKAGHVWNEGEVTTAATCTVDGVKTFTCTVCDETETEVITAPGHDWNEGEVTTEPTCTEKGVKTFTCTVCGDTYTEEVAAKGHVEEAIPGEEPTCTRPGLTDDGVWCAVCHETIKAPTLIIWLGHDIEKTEAKAATCTEIGWEAYETCKRCGETDYVEIPALGHDFEEVEGLLPSCTEAGFQGYYECNNEGCDLMFDLNKNEITEPVVIAPIGHIADSSTAATCTTPRTCVECGAAFGRALGHNWGMYAYDEEVLNQVGFENFDLAIEFNEFGMPVFVKGAYLEAMPADCTQAGCEAFTFCYRCGEFALVDEEGEITESGLGYTDVLVPAMSGTLTHTTNDVSGLLPTCTEKGYYAYVECTVCGYFKYEDGEGVVHEWRYNTVDKTDADENGVYDLVEIDALGHEFDPAKGATELVGEFVAGTCTTESETYYQCARCTVVSDAVLGQKDADNHNITIDEAGTTADCLNDGEYAYQYCDRCENYLVNTEDGLEVYAKADFEANSEEYLFVEKLGHEFDPAKGATELVGEFVAGTCTTESETYYQCARCTVVSDAVLGQKDADNHNITIDEAGTTADCLNDGEYAYQYCDRCETYFVNTEDGLETYAKADFEANAEEYLFAEKLGHDWKETSRTNSTCQTKGNYVETCQRTGCSVTQTFELELVACEKDEATKTVVKMPTCQEKGYVTYACKYAYDGCTKVFEEYPDVDTENGHNWDVQIDEATCCTVYEEYYKCTICGERGEDITIGTDFDSTKHYNQAAIDGRKCAEYVTCDVCSTVANPVKFLNPNPVAHSYNILGNCVFCSAVYSGEYTGGDYGIYKAEQLWYFAELVNDGETFENCTVTLYINIDLENAAWTPIGNTSTTPFAGTFDGNGKTISNLNVTADQAAGLFGYVRVGTVKNLTVDGAEVNSKHYAGVIAAHAYGYFYNCTVKNAEVNCIDTVDDGDMDGDKAGAIVGFLASDSITATVDGCVAENVTITANRDAGQLVGAAHNVAVVNGTATNVTVSYSNYGSGDNIKNELVGRVVVLP